jgi:hypothetical protein
MKLPPFNIWDIFTALLSPMSASVPLIVAEGNHDGAWGENFLPLRTRLAPPGAYYVVDRACARFIVLSVETSSDEEADDDGHRRTALLADNQLSFLRTQLRSARSNNSPIRWIIVVAHRVMLCRHC